MKLPVSVGVPEIVITLADHVAVTPGGKPSVIWAIPVAPVVAILIGVKEVFTVSVGGVEVAAAVLGIIQPQVGFLFWSIMIDCPGSPDSRLCQFSPFQYKNSPLLLPRGKSALLNFVSNAACVAVETCLFASEVLSTFPKPTIVLVIPPTVPVKEGLLTGAFSANLFVRFKEAVSVFAAYIA